MLDAAIPLSPIPLPGSTRHAVRVRRGSARARDTAVHRAARPVGGRARGSYAAAGSGTADLPPTARAPGPTLLLGRVAAVSGCGL